MLNGLWAFLIICSIAYTVLVGNMSSLNTMILEGLQSGFQLIGSMAPILLLWMGLMQIASSSKLLEKIARYLTPLLAHLFPSLSKTSKSLEYIASNVACNLFGLGSAATPFGLKAMQELQKENESKEEATDAMITFIVLNTSGVTLVPTTLMAIRTSFGANTPPALIGCMLMATTISTIAGLSLDRWIRRKK